MNKKIKKHRKRVRRILKKLQEIGLQTKKNKCKFEKLEIEIFEWVISKKEVRSSPEYRRVIKQ